MSTMYSVRYVAVRYVEVIKGLTINRPLHEKVFAMSRCPLYSMTALYRFDVTVSDDFTLRIKTRQFILLMADEKLNKSQIRKCLNFEKQEKSCCMFFAII